MRPSDQLVIESHNYIIAKLKAQEGLSAYDIMDLWDADHVGEAKNDNFAARQRISGGCSELHAEGRIHQIGIVKGRQIYRFNNNPTQPCPCGSCPDGGKGYKARYELACEKIKQLEMLVKELAPYKSDSVKKDTIADAFFAAQESGNWESLKDLFVNKR